MQKINTELFKKALVTDQSYQHTPEPHVDPTGGFLGNNPGRKSEFKQNPPSPEKIETARHLIGEVYDLLETQGVPREIGQKGITLLRQALQALSVVNSL